MDIHDVIREMMDKHVAFVEDLLSQLPDDLILCIHEAEFQRSPSSPESDEQRYIARTVTHLIQSPGDCKARVMRTQYKMNRSIDGPGTPEH